MDGKTLAVFAGDVNQSHQCGEFFGAILGQF